MKVFAFFENQLFYENLEGKINKLAPALNLIYRANINTEGIENGDKVIVSNKYAENEGFVEEIIRKVGKRSNIYVLLDSLNNEEGKTFVLKGFSVHYLSSPIFSLLCKLEKGEALEIAEETQRAIAYSEDTKFIGVSSAAGGTGKTTISALLAASLSKKKKNILMVDLNPYSDMAVKLQLKHSNGLSHLISILNKEEQSEKLNSLFDDSIIHYSQRDVSFDILYGADPIQIEKIDSSLVNKMFGCVKHNQYDFVIFDLPSYVSEMTLSAMDCVDYIMMVISPDIGNGWKLIQQKELMDTFLLSQKCGFVVNKYLKRSSFSCKILEKELQYPLLGVVPYVEELVADINNGKLSTYFDSSSFMNYVNLIANEFAEVYSQAELKVKKISR